MPLEIAPEIQWYLDNKLTHQLHTSERKAFRACRRRWNWVYREQYSPQVSVPPLEFGIAFHKAMEIFYEPRTWSAENNWVRTNLAIVTFKRECEEHLRNYRKNVDPDPDVLVLQEYKNRIELGINMIKYYCGVMSPIYDRDWTPVRVEVGFEVPIKDPENDKQVWCKCDLCWKRFYNWLKTNRDSYQIKWDEKWISSNGNEFTTEEALQLDQHQFINWKGLPVTYGGRLDALFLDKYDRYWIADWKTTARLLDEDQEASFLQLDDQVSSYLWALSQYGITCAGFVYVEIKKTYPAPPERLQRAYKGRQFSTNKQSLTTYDMALKTFSKEDNDAWQMGLYDDYLTWLRSSDGPKFTQRHQIHKNEHEIRNIGNAIAVEAMDIINKPRIYPMPGRFSCNWCLFKQPCLGMNMGEDWQYTLDTMFDKFDKFYWEEKASTE